MIEHTNETGLTPSQSETQSTRGNYTTSTKRQPPYARRAQALIASRKPSGFGDLAVTYGWDTACFGLPKISLPVDSDPSQFNWRAVAGLRVLIVLGDMPMRVLRLVIAELSKAHAKQVSVFDIEGFRQDKDLDIYWPVIVGGASC
jgi:hypothetical protein